MGGETGNEGNDEPSQPRHIELVTDESKEHKNGENGNDPSPVLTNGKGWDGKLRVPGRATLANPEALSDPEYSDEDNVVPGEEIQADEGMLSCCLFSCHITNTTPSPSPWYSLCETCVD